MTSSMKTCVVVLAIAVGFFVILESLKIASKAVDLQYAQEKVLIERGFTYMPKGAWVPVGALRRMKEEPKP
jgi:hypothetical protein